MPRREGTNETLAKGPREATSEIRQDLVTGDWVVMARGRAARPHDVKTDQAVAAKPAHFKKGCPFCELDVFPQKPTLLRLPDDAERWQVHIFPNKYPALGSGELGAWETGPYRAVAGVGYHEVIALRWHDQVDYLMTQQEWAWQVEVLVWRFRQLQSEMNVNYIQIIKNCGAEAGQSLEHPHMQLFTVPVLPTDVARMLQGAEAYAKRTGKEVFAQVLEFERSTQERVVWENEHFTIFCPYASRVPYEMWIMPREQNPFFEAIGPEEQSALAESFQQALRRLHAALPTAPYNFYIHSAPCDEHGFVCDKDQFKHFRWHVEILPRLAKWGGFELGTGLEINTTPPEEAARLLREQAVWIVE